MQSGTFGGLPLGQTHTPHPRFNLLHIDRTEHVLESLRVSIFDSTQNCLEAGFLHLCSRSLVFDSDNLVTDLLRLFFTSSNFQVEVFTGEALQG